ncbi:hypothetical protein [Mesobacillus harenae]|uniref:hypothetical protein n=1 Tax=Mesobacillus harenae TaxID=2213203 RepID=UPI00158018D8|nr:hypothetical protein [Mesobacillus harenae]
MTNKKTLIITGMNKEVVQMLPQITNRTEEQIVILNSFDNEVSHPYGCTVRNIIRTLLMEEIEEIFIVAEKGQKNPLDSGALLLKMKESGISEDTIKTINYIKAANGDVMSWLAGQEDVKTAVKGNMTMIQNHPIIPKGLLIQGFLVNTQTGEFEVVR